MKRLWIWIVAMMVFVAATAFAAITSDKPPLEAPQPAKAIEKKESKPVEKKGKASEKKAEETKKPRSIEKKIIDPIKIGP
jgi:hypothetical protein